MSCLAGARHLCFPWPPQPFPLPRSPILARAPIPHPKARHADRTSARRPAHAHQPCIKARIPLLPGRAGRRRLAAGSPRQRYALSNPAGRASGPLRPPERRVQGQTWRRRTFLGDKERVGAAGVPRPRLLPALMCMPCGHSWSHLTRNSVCVLCVVAGRRGSVGPAHSARIGRRGSGGADRAAQLRMRHVPCCVYGVVLYTRSCARPGDRV